MEFSYDDFDILAADSLSGILLSIWYCTMM